MLVIQIPIKIVAKPLHQINSKAKSREEKTKSCSVATRKRSKNTSSPAIQTTPEKLLDQHQRQTSHQTQAPPTESALGSQFSEVEQLLSKIKELKATVQNNESKISSLERKVSSLTGEVLILNAELATTKHVSTLLSEKIDDQGQYSRRPCLVFKELNSVDDDNKNLSQDIVNIIKIQEMISTKATHPKKIKENRYIAKFTKSSTAERIY